MTRATAIRLLADALRRQRVHWENLPSGIDSEADPRNTSPDDAFAHEAGLAVRDIDATLNEVKKWLLDPVDTDE